MCATRALCDTNHSMPVRVLALGSGEFSPGVYLKTAVQGWLAADASAFDKPEADVGRVQGARRTPGARPRTGPASEGRMS